ncbi:MAG TPA: HepT-like ribonuclease domain-containing protein [Mucilaginibacter sp.]|nr:HepT-like ribonuclease domain-containing protein [Mucilaginibacter sp.]
MDRKAKLYFDIVASIDLIEEFLGPIDLFDEYSVDRKTQSAIERQLGIVGEAVKRIKDIDPDEHIQYRDEIVGFRNILVHGYDIIDNGTVWLIIKDYLAPLKQEILRKLENE